MADESQASLEAGPEQLRYASVLRKGMYSGLLILFITFAIYVFGIVKSYIPLNEISSCWSMNVQDYLDHTKIKDGWSWVGMLRYSEFINFIGIAILAGVTIICYVAIVPLLLKNNDKVYALLSVLEVIILALAASGILTVGH
ncbi:MAG: DUF1634 domain-containing protein [Pseudomonadota bacterium]